MEHSIWFFIALVVFSSFVGEVTGKMMKDQQPVIRFLGYVVAIVMAIAVLWLVLYWYFNINLLSLLAP